MDDTLLAGQERDKARIEELVSQLNAASEAYYGGRDEIMSNFEWDSKFDELSVLEAKTGYVLPESPTQNVSFSEEESSERNLPLTGKKKLMNSLHSLLPKQRVCRNSRNGLKIVPSGSAGNLTD